jgi:ketosteroid isomerase-like protein
MKSIYFLLLIVFFCCSSFTFKYKNTAMNTENEALIHRFYTAFQQRDFATMQSCYAENATFNDPAFVNLNAAEVRAMWKMLLTRGKDLQLEYKNVTANDTEGSAEWVATYTFSQTKRKVTNHIKANFIFENGKIVQHKDDFNFYTWSRQALGLPGFLLGHTAFLRKKVQSGARKSLLDFMQ